MWLVGRTNDSRRIAVSTSSTGSRSSYSISASCAARTACSIVVAATANIEWPTYCTSRSAKIGSSLSTPPTSLTPGTSSAVTTATTPGARRTGSRFIDRMRAWARLVVPMAACSVPRGSGMSSV